MPLSEKRKYFINIGLPLTSKKACLADFLQARKGREVMKNNRREAYMVIWPFACKQKFLDFWKTIPNREFSSVASIKNTFNTAGFFFSPEKKSLAGLLTDAIELAAINALH